MTSTPNARIRDARERAGLESTDIADRLGLPFPHYRDLEDFEDEAATTISLETLLLLARILGTTPRVILEGDAAAAPSRRLTFEEFSAAVAAAVERDGGDADAWGDRVGWDVVPLLQDPETIWELDADALRDIAGAAGVDWLTVLPE